MNRPNETDKASPYSTLPDHCFWRRSIAAVDYTEVDPVTASPFRIRPDERIATAGSCFAQHLARRLKASGFNFFVTETAHPLASPEIATSFNYAVFSARYGNIYTSRQLLQLLERALGLFETQENAWRSADGRYLDPLRPTIQPGGFATLAELAADRRQHLAAVHRAFTQMDYFVFTLGLTECWVSRDDGTAFPVAPGVAGGRFDPERYALLNLGAADVQRDMDQFITALRRINPTVRIILTVSPVPLVATAENRHVLVATTYSKSVLRVVCDELVRAHADVAYFPSYEIITASCSAGRYFGSDWRSVTEDGVSHVMRVFLRHFTEGGETQPGRPTEPRDTFVERMSEVVEAICDEERIDKY